MKCEYCGEEFIATSLRQKYCSSKCRWRKNNKTPVQASKVDCKSTRKCEWCGKEFVPIQYRSRFCTYKCNTAERNFRTGKSKTDVRKRPDKICIICGNEFEDNSKAQTKVYCSNVCKNRADTLRKNPNARTQEEIHKQSLINKAEKEKQKAEALKIYQDKQKRIQEQRIKRKEQEYKSKHHATKCIVCGREFEKPHPNQLCCSQKCSRINKNRIAHNRKKRYKEITIDSDISLFKLANRDKQQCKICGLFVDWTDKKEIDGTVVCGDMYPSIDHITPISLGGLHEWTNVQLAHRVCNYRKSNKYIG